MHYPTTPTEDTMTTTYRFHVDLTAFDDDGEALDFEFTIRAIDGDVAEREAIARLATAYSTVVVNRVQFVAA